MSIDDLPQNWSLESFLYELQNGHEHACPSSSIQFHFNVPNNCISAQTLANVASGLQEVADIIFRDSLANGERIEILLGVPKEGSYEADFLITGVELIIGGVVPCFLNAFCKDMLGKSLFELTEIAARGVSQGCKKFLMLSYVSTAISVYLSKRVDGAEEIFSSFPIEKRGLQNGKNTTYRSVQCDETVKSFSLDGQITIERDSFNQYIDSSIDDNETSNEIEFREGTIQVVSPVSLKGKTNRGWSGNFFEKRRRSVPIIFSMLDSNFKEYTIFNKIKTAVDDVMKVQMIKLPLEKIKWNVLKVLEFEGQRVSEPLSPEELAEFNVVKDRNHDRRLSLLTHFD